MKYFSKQIRLIAVALLLTGLVAFFSIEYSNTPASSEAKEKNWSMPTMLHIKANANDKKLLQQLNIWKSKATMSASDATNINWSLKGIVFESKIPYALVYQDDENRLSKYKVNDLLPNGEKLTRISSNHITFELDGETMTTKLHQHHTAL